MLEFFENPIFSLRDEYISLEANKEKTEYFEILDFQNEIEKLREID